MPQTATHRETERDGPASAEWAAFRAGSSKHRDALERTLLRALVHDPRCGDAPRDLPRALADQSVQWAAAEFRSKPAGVPAEQWMRKHGLELLDEALERAAAGRRCAAGHETVNDLLSDDAERALWLGFARRETRRGAPGGDGEETAEIEIAVGGIEARLFETERLADLERALSHLPELRRRAVTHRYLDDMTVEEIADILSIARADVERELASAEKAIRLELGGA